MSMHKEPLTEQEREGLIAAGLPVDKPSQLADAFRLGMRASTSGVGGLSRGTNLCAWLRENSSGVYRNSALAADIIEELDRVITTYEEKPTTGNQHKMFETLAAMKGG